MRAIYYPFDKIENTIELTGEAAKHLQVVRVKKDESVLLLNGTGKKAFTKVGQISKNSIELLISGVESEERKHNIHLAIATPKKDAFEDILKIAVELGVVSIQPIRSEFSQFEYAPNDRFSRLMESALVQSNNVFFPELLNQTNLDQFLSQNDKELYFFNSRQTTEQKIQQTNKEKIILIGPEGGFSEREITLISNQREVVTIHLPTPIQRAPTAVASSFGYLIGRMQ